MRRVSSLQESFCFLGDHEPECKAVSQQPSMPGSAAIFCMSSPLSHGAMHPLFLPAPLQQEPSLIMRCHSLAPLLITVTPRTCNHRLAVAR